MLAGGKDCEPAIGAHARISLTYDVALLSTICMFSLVPSHFKLSFTGLREFLTGSLKHDNHRLPVFFFASDEKENR